MKVITPRSFFGLKKILLAALCLLAAHVAVSAQDLSQFNLSPEQMARFSSLDSATQQKVLLALQKQKGTTTKSAGSESLKKDQMALSDKSAAASMNAPLESVLPTEVAPAVAMSQMMMAEEEDDTLRLYGYDIFSTGNYFEPTIQLPVPVDYLMGAGDSVVVNFYGKTSASYELTVTREGNLNVPEIGSVNVSGLTFIETKSEILRRVKDQLIGVEASVTMGELRSIRVYIMGEVVRPGSYAVSSLSTITNALFACGGVKESGSLRAIQLKRSGKLVASMDLYDLLMAGDNSNDARLQPGDVILVPPIGETASVSGAVVRPAVYEIKGSEDVSDLIALAGGCRSDAYLGASQLQRIDPISRKRTIVSVDLSDESSSIDVHNGDDLMVLPIAERVHDSVKISGHVALPRSLQWHEGMRLLDAIPSVDDLLPKADLMYVLIKRENPHTGYISVRSTRLDAAFADADSKWNLELSPLDEIIVLNDEVVSDEELDVMGGAGTDEMTQAVPGYANEQMVSYMPSPVGTPVASSTYGYAPTPYAQQPVQGIESKNMIKRRKQVGMADALRQVGQSSKNEIFEDEEGALDFVLDEKSPQSSLERDLIIEELVEQLHQQRSYNAPGDTVIVSGSVRYPGEYPYEKNMKVLDLMRAARDLNPDADMNYAIIVRDHNDDVSVIDLSLPKSVEDELSPWNYPLEPQDELHIFSLYGDRSEELADYLEKLQQQATEQDLVRIVSLSGQVRHPGEYPFRSGMRISDLLRAGGAFNSGAYTLEAELTRSVILNGRSFNVTHENIDLASVLNGEGDADLELQPFDNLMIRPIPDWAEDVSVQIGGEVIFPGTYKVKKGETLLQLIERAGGFTEQASPVGGVFLRESLRRKEQQQLDRLRDRVRADLTAASIEKSVTGGEIAEYGTNLLDQLEAVEAVGRMVIDLPAMIQGKGNYPDVILKNGDILYIPQAQQEVMVLGEVLHPTSHIFRDGVGYEDYIEMSGGTSTRADTDRIYIIKANGSVQTTQSSSLWFPARVNIEPGDSIIVPFDADYISPLPLWKDVTGIIYNLAVSAAAVASF
ncbi:MAG: SLBB domain-containing protein [Opitutales bacterium]|nr:SLBB domain-containing protein [Opitutales bacterium]